MLLWMRAAVIIYALFFGLRPFPGLDHVARDAVHHADRLGDAASSAPWSAACSRPSPSPSASSRSRCCSTSAIDALTAMGTSMALVWNNLPVMLAWGAIVLALFVLSLATGLLGLIVVFPAAGPRAPGMPTRPSDDAARSEPSVMSCCAPARAAPWRSRRRGRQNAARQPRPRRRPAPDRPVGARHPLRGCIAAVEQALGGLGVERARVNLSTQARRRRTGAATAPPPLVATLHGAGYDAHLHDAGVDERDPEHARAGPGAGGRGLRRQQHHAAVGRRSGPAPTPATRDLFHWISARSPCRRWPIPAASSSARPGARCAHGRTNMDVPISIGVLLAFGLSLYDTRPSRPARLFRRGDVAAVLPADRPHARPRDARAGAHRRQRAGTAAPRAARPSREPTAAATTCRSTRSSPA